MDEVQQPVGHATSVPPTPPAVPVKLARPWQATVVAVGMLTLGGIVQAGVLGFIITCVLAWPDRRTIEVNAITAIIIQPIALFAFILARRLLLLFPSTRRHALTFHIVLLIVAFIIAAGVFVATVNVGAFILAVILIGILFGTSCVLLTRPEVTEAYDRQSLMPPHR